MCSLTNVSLATTEQKRIEKHGKTDILVLWHDEREREFFIYHKLYSLIRRFRFRIETD